MIVRMLRENQLLFLALIFITETVSVPIIQTSRCNPQRENCSLIFSRNRNSSLTPYRYTSPLNSLADLDSFNENLKRAALILAGVAIALGILRICLMLCRSRSSQQSDQQSSASCSSNDSQQFKPDLPPVYADAIATVECDGNKLPTYEELPYEQRQYQCVCNDNRGYSSS